MRDLQLGGDLLERRRRLGAPLVQPGDLHLSGGATLGDPVRRPVQLGLPLGQTAHPGSVRQRCLAAIGLQPHRERLRLTQKASERHLESPCGLSGRRSCPETLLEQGEPLAALASPIGRRLAFFGTALGSRRALFLLDPGTREARQRRLVLLLGRHSSRFGFGQGSGDRRGPGQRGGRPCIQFLQFAGDRGQLRL